MGIFDKIKSAIWGEAEAAEPEQPVPAEQPAVTAPADPAAQAKVEAAVAAPATPAPAPAPAPEVDVAAILDVAAAKNGQTLDWRRSIVDLMKALGLDSSLGHRRELAAELGYSGDTGDSAAMNVWLHKAVIQKLKENGGKVPADL